MNKKEMAIWWFDLHPLSRVELAKKYYPNIKYSKLTEVEIEKMFVDEVEKKIKNM